MAEYEVTVYVQYDDCVVVEADNEEDAKALAEKKALDNVEVFASVDVRAYDDLKEIT